MSPRQPRTPRPKMKDFYAGDASVLDAPLETTHIPHIGYHPPSPVVGPSSVTGRARIVVSDMAKRAGLPCEPEMQRGTTRPHVHLGTKKVHFHARVKVARQKFQIRDHLAKVLAGTKLEEPGTLPVLFYKIAGLPHLAVMPMADFFRLLTALEGEGDE